MVRLTTGTVTGGKPMQYTLLHDRTATTTDRSTWAVDVDQFTAWD